eukprot:ANDGO_08097.mRNA.1 hypothetical protein
MQDDGTWLPDETAQFDLYLSSLNNWTTDLPSFESLASQMPAKHGPDILHKYAVLLYDITRLEMLAHTASLHSHPPPLSQSHPHPHPHPHSQSHSTATTAANSAASSTAGLAGSAAKSKKRNTPPSGAALNPPPSKKQEFGSSAFDNPLQLPSAQQPHQQSLSQSQQQQPQSLQIPQSQQPQQQPQPQPQSQPQPQPQQPTNDLSPFNEMDALFN